ncbi:hypothetical protein ACIQAL_22965 [Pseudomonas sp. NPDC088368]|uniref:hypothetical protein n=1 Tax=Pseudomonas sp. NPDC088368 TaxID=3364453 RepID=UPI0038240D23
MIGAFPDWKGLLRAFYEVTQHCHGGRISEKPSVEAPDPPFQTVGNVQVSVFCDVAAAEKKSRHVRHHEHHVQAHMSAHYSPLPNASDLRDTSAVGQTILQKVDISIGEPHQNDEVEPRRNA